MNIKFHYSIQLTFYILIFLSSSCNGMTKPAPTSSPEATLTPTILIKNTPFITITPINTPPLTVTSIISPTSNACNPSQWQGEGIYILSLSQFEGSDPGGPNAINQILISQNPVWGDFQQYDHGEMRTAGKIFHESAWGPNMGEGVSPTILLITYGVELDWELPPYGALVARVVLMRNLIYQYKSEWYRGEVDQSKYPPIKNSASYALFRYFDGDQEILEKWCRTYIDVFGESPLEE